MSDKHDSITTDYSACRTFNSWSIGTNLGLTMWHVTRHFSGRQNCWYPDFRPHNVWVYRRTMYFRRTTCWSWISMETIISNVFAYKRLFQMLHSIYTSFHSWAIIAYLAQPSSHLAFAGKSHRIGIVRSLRSCGPLIHSFVLNCGNRKPRDIKDVSNFDTRGTLQSDCPSKSTRGCVQHVSPMPLFSVV